MRTGGDAGANVLNGNAGNDTILAGDGNDSVTGGDGNDTLLGGNGNDYLQGDAGADVMNGQLGSDNLVGGTGIDRFIINFDEVFGAGSGSNLDRCFGGAEADIYEFRGCTPLVAGIVVLDDVKVANMRSYMAAEIAAGLTDLDMNLDTLDFVLTPPGPY